LHSTKLLIESNIHGYYYIFIVAIASLTTSPLVFMNSKANSPRKNSFVQKQTGMLLFSFTKLHCNETLII